MTSDKRKGAKTLEVHEHVFITGPRSNGMFICSTQRTTSHFSHSHAGGDVPHAHPDTGPGSYTIDKDDWLRTTGLRGGGRKKYTAKPVGEQFERVELDRSQTEFEVIVCQPPKDFGGEGAGVAPIFRMVLGHKMVATVRRG